MAKHKKECDCLFCSSKCPECGSEAISVKFNVGWEYDNEDLNNIHISQTEASIEVDCEDCGETYCLGEWGNDQRLNPLQKVLFRALNLPGSKFFSIDEENNITTKQPISVSRKEGD